MSKYDALKQKLESRQNELNDRLARLKRDISQSHSQDWDEQAQERENDEVLNQLGEGVEDELQGIGKALQLMAEGEYGTCVDCAIEIPMARLEAKPHAIRCVKCA